MHQKTDSVPSVSRRDGVPCEELRHAFEEAAELLPAQGPITVFVHHNTLHAFEHLPFHEAVVRGAELFGCEPYLSEDRYREELARGRIRRDDLYNAVRADLGERADELIGGLARRLDLRMAMLEHPLQVASPAELRLLPFILRDTPLDEIADQLNLSYDSARKYRSALFLRLELRSPSELRAAIDALRSL